MIPPERKGWAFYRTGELVSCCWAPKRDDAGWSENCMPRYNALKKRASSFEEGLSSLPEGEWGVAESQRGMMQDEVKIVFRGATPWKTGIFLRGRVELFTGGWVSWYWVPKRDDAEKEKNDYKTDEGNRKGKYKHHFWCNLMCKKDFSFFAKYL